MFEPDYAFRVKVVLLGDGEVGKTTMARTFLSGRGQIDTSYRQTIGADIHVKKDLYDIAPFGKVEVMWNIFDLAGQPQFKYVHPNYYKGAKAAIIVFDVSRKKTFDNIKYWIQDLIKYVGEPKPMIIVGNKIDLRDKIPCLPSYVGERYAEELRARLNVPIYYAETSALYGINVQESFYLLAKTLIEYAKQRAKQSEG